MPPHFQEVLATRSAPLVKYARHWFGLVGQELLAEVADGVGRPPSKAAEYNVSFVRASEKNPRISIVSVSGADQTSGPRGSGDRGELDGEDPPLNYQAGRIPLGRRRPGFVFVALF